MRFYYIKRYLSYTRYIVHYFVLSSFLILKSFSGYNLKKKINSAIYPDYYLVGFSLIRKKNKSNVWAFNNLDLHFIETQENNKNTVFQ